MKTFVNIKKEVIEFYRTIDSKVYTVSVKYPMTKYLSYSDMSDDTFKTVAVAIKDMEVA